MRGGIEINDIFVIILIIFLKSLVYVNILIIFTSELKTTTLKNRNYDNSRTI